MVYRATPAASARLEAKRGRILSAARARVAVTGFAGLRVSEVAAAARVATGTLYRYFPSKGALCVEVFRQVSGGEVAHLESLGPHADPRAGLVEVVTAFAQRALQRPRLAYALLAEPLSPEVEAERLRYRRAYAGVFARLVRAGVAKGHFPPQEPSLSAAWVVGALGEALTGPLAADAADAADALCPELCALALRSLGADPLTPRSVTP